jgi:hypothetical protein
VSNIETTGIDVNLFSALTGLMQKWSGSATDAGSLTKRWVKSRKITEMSLKSYAVPSGRMR